jgi:glycopeptide antibiotics resistance protein
MFKTSFSKNKFKKAREMRQINVNFCTSVFIALNQYFFKNPDVGNKENED